LNESGIERIADIVYAERASRALRMDLYRPSARTDKLPIVVWIHGGAWRTGDKGEEVGHLAPLVRAGVACARIEYRYSSEACFPAQLQDVAAAVAYVRAHADTFGVDPQRVGLWGDSAGGHLVLLYGLAPSHPALARDDGSSEEPRCVQAVCDWYGPTDLLHFGSDLGVADTADTVSPIREFVGGQLRDQAEVARSASPVTWATGDAPPLLIVHGTADTVVPIAQSERLFDMLRTCGADVTFERVPEAGHGWPGFWDCEAQILASCRFLCRRLGVAMQR